VPHSSGNDIFVSRGEDNVPLGGSQPAPGSGGQPPPPETADEDLNSNIDINGQDNNLANNDVKIMNKHEDRAASFFAQPGILAGQFSLFFSHNIS